MRVSDEYFPMIGGGTGGTIYQWTLGWYVSAHDVAKKFGRQEIYRFLIERSPEDARFVQNGRGRWSLQRDLVRASMRYSHQPRSADRAS